MQSTITFFPVDNGDMTLIKLEDKTTILIDINIRQATENDEDPTCNVSKELRELLEKDNNGRPFVDVFLLSHPDRDHCTGLQNNFHLGLLDNYVDKPPKDEALKIIIGEIWSSPLVFRRSSKNHTLCDDAKAFSTEARRRVNLYKEKKQLVYGDRIIVIGKDENGKTDGLEEILKEVGDVINIINGKSSSHCTACVIAPFPIQEDEEAEEKITKNHSSVIMQFSFKVDGVEDSCLFLTSGDAEVYIWEKLWDEHKRSTSKLQYDLMLAPHHCSWHVLSYDSWSENKNPQINKDAKCALTQMHEGAFIVSSSKPIKDDDTDPPCWGAKNEYKTSLDVVKGEFFCTGEYPNEERQEPLIFKLTKNGPQPPSKKSESITGPAVIIGSTKEPVYHGQE
jgi:hypothetical protein